MATFRVSMSVYDARPQERLDDEPLTRPVVTNFAGCRDEDEARAKARAIFPVERFKSVTKVE